MYEEQFSKRLAELRTKKGVCVFFSLRKARKLSHSEVSSTSASGGKDTHYVHLEGIWQSNQYAP